MTISSRPTRERKEQVLAWLREKGLRLTAQRMAVLEYLLSTDEHPSARKIFENARRSLPRIGLSTVYGILAELSRKGVIRALQFKEMDNRYEADLSQHINLVCLQCGKISDYVTAYTIDPERILEAARFRVLRSRFELYGICGACGKKKQGKKILESLRKTSRPLHAEAARPDAASDPGRRGCDLGNNKEAQNE